MVICFLILGYQPLLRQLMSFRIALSFLIILIAVSDTNGSSHIFKPHRENDPCISQNIELFFEETMQALYCFDFFKADSISKAFLHRYPEHFMAYLARANYFWWMILTNPDSVDYNIHFNENVNRSIHYQTTNCNQTNEFATLFYSISLFAISARLELMNGNYFGALRRGMRSVNYIDVSHQKTEYYKGFYLTSGLYLYIIDVATLRYPLFRLYNLLYLAGDKETGIEYLQKASATGYFIWSTEADYFLMRIFGGTENEPYKSFVHSKALTEKYPDNIIYRYYHLLNMKVVSDEQQVLTEIQAIRDLIENHRGLAELQKMYLLGLIDS